MPRYFFSLRHRPGENGLAVDHEGDELADETLVRAHALHVARETIAKDRMATLRDFVALMLGVQRSSATLAIQALEGYRLIKAQRGRMTVLDREGLEKAVDSGYGLPEAEYARLIEGA